MRDLHIYGGLALATIGGAFLSLPVALVALGVALAWLGIYQPGPPQKPVEEAE